MNLIFFAECEKQSLRIRIFYLTKIRQFIFLKRNKPQASDKPLSVVPQLNNHLKHLKIGTK
jgi:hypothetical protein